MILLATLLAHGAPQPRVPKATEAVIVEMVQTAPGDVPTGFRITPDGRWLDLDGEWTERTQLDAARVSTALQVVAAAGNPTVPKARVNDAVGITTWRLGERTVVVPDGVSVPALSALYSTLQALPAVATASSVWSFEGVEHTVACSAAGVPALSALTGIWTAGPPLDGQRLAVEGKPLLDVRWLEGVEEIGRSVILVDGRVGTSTEGVLVHRRTLNAEQLSALKAGLAAVDWAGCCG